MKFFRNYYALVNKRSVFLLLNEAKQLSVRIKVENIVFSSDLFYYILHDFNLFPSLQNVLNDKKNVPNKIRWKLLEIETTWILLERIQKLPDKGQKVIKNNEEYIIDWKRQCLK